MNWCEVLLVISTFLCSLVAGLVLTFAIVVMPGLKMMEDRDFLRAFKAMDGIIQNNQPIFILVWVGSALMAILLAATSIWWLGGVERVWVLLLAAIYLVGVHLPTVTINIPLNNKLQSLDLDKMSTVELRQAREDFEPRWNFWNLSRTVLACFVTFGFIVIALRL